MSCYKNIHKGINDYEKLGETHTSLGNLDKALKYFEDEADLFKELYESNKNNVRFKNGLAISYIKLAFSYDDRNNKEKTLEHLKKAKPLLQELHNDFPNHPEFKRNLDRLNNLLEEIKE